MGLYTYFLYTNSLLYSSKEYQLKYKKKLKKENYILNPNIKTYIDIINLNRQINAIKIKKKKQGKSKLRDEFIIT